MDYNGVFNKPGNHNADTIIYFKGVSLMKKIDKERIEKHIDFARKYVRDFDHGASGHIDYHTIAYLAEQLDIAHKENIHLKAKQKEQEQRLKQYRAPIEIEGFVSAFEMSITQDYEDSSSWDNQWRTSIPQRPYVSVTIESNDVELGNYFGELQHKPLFIQIKAMVK